MERTQEELRPVGHPLHQRVEDHQGEGGRAQRDAAGETLKDSVKRTAFSGLSQSALQLVPHIHSFIQTFPY